MDWFDRLVPRGTVYTTFRLATERPGLVARLAETHEIGVHVHPREFGHAEDDLGALSGDRQVELISRTREAVAEATGNDPSDLTAFRAGRHKASPTTLAVLSDLGFEIDASINVRYREHLSAELTDRVAPFVHESGIVELPTTFGRPPTYSRIGLWAGPGSTVTATAHSLRTDRAFCSGFDAVSWLFENTDSVFSFYCHPYDASGHAEVENAGVEFRDRVERLLRRCDQSYVTAGDVCTATQS